MKGKYKAAFIIPRGAKKVLGEYGWEFETSKSVCSEVSEYLVNSLHLKLLEKYFGLDDYVNESIKMSVVYDDYENIENIYFQLYEDALTDLLKVCQNVNALENVELFIPEQESE